MNHPKVVTYAQVLSGEVNVGRRVAVIGSGGIGVDICAFLLGEHSQSAEAWAQQWGIDLLVRQPGGLTTPGTLPAQREITLLQRSADTRRMGSGPGRTTGWAHRALLKQAGIRMLGGCEYTGIDDRGLHLRLDGGKTETIEADHIVICAGQESVQTLAPCAPDGRVLDQRFHIIGGALLAGELDARRAIREGAKLAARL